MKPFITLLFNCVKKQCSYFSARNGDLCSDFHILDSECRHFFFMIGLPPYSYLAEYTIRFHFQAKVSD